MSKAKGCTGCGFRAARGAIQCEYCLLTGKPRGCPAGAGCNKWQAPAQVDKLRRAVQRNELHPVEPWDAIWT